MNSDLLEAGTHIPDHVLFQDIEGRAVLLNLDNESYFGLDDVGTAMWQMLEKQPTIGAAARQLAEVYDAPLETIREDLIKLVIELKDQGLIEFTA